MVRYVKAPGPLRKAAGFYYQEFSTIKSLSLFDDPFKVGSDKNKSTNWVEFIIPETAKTLAKYDDPFFGKYPAITENKFGKGSLVYEGSLLSDEIQIKLVGDKARQIGLMDDNQIAYPVVTRSGTNDQGKTIRYYLNYSGKEQSVIYNFEKGTALLTNKALKRGDSFVLKPWDLLIVEE